MTKPKIIILLFVLIIIFLLLSYNVSMGCINKITFENNILEIAKKNEESIFTINNITLFSSADSTSEIQPNSSLTLNNLYQYTDIALFLVPVKNELTYENTLKEVYIDNINFVSTPTDGTPGLYYKNINQYTTSEYLINNKIDNSLHFTISSGENEDLNYPVLYNNCANPITLCYVNNNIRTNYTLPDAFSQITYDGSLLKKCGIPLSSITCSISFNIHVTNNLDQEFVCPIYFDIPLELEDKTSIYDGKVLYKDTSNYVFYRTK